jgi:CO/xanthine dehydrogenase FAD-binding subunit
MKPAPFEYYAPATEEEAMSYLSEHGYDAKALAGGQSLIPMMNFRLAQPSILVDLNKISTLSHIHVDEQGELHIGAMTRHATVEHDPLVAKHTPLIYEAMPHIAMPQIRNRGTFGGSMAHADPSAELVAISVALAGRFHLRSQTGERWLPANEFFIGMFTTPMEPDELFIEGVFPALPPRTGWALQEVARRPHDFALVGVATVVTLDQNKRCQSSRIVFLSVSDRPVEAYKAVEVLKNQLPTSEIIRNASEMAAIEDVDPGNDIHASADFRRHLVKVLTGRALTLAFERSNRNSF